MNLNRLYKFNTIASNILGTAYNNMKLLAIMDHTQAAKETDILNIHNSIQGILANSNLPITVESCTFLKFQSADGSFVVFAKEYLTDIEEIKSSTLVITVNNYTDSDYVIIRDALNKLGYSNLKFELK